MVMVVVISLWSQVTIGTYPNVMVDGLLSDSEVSRVNVEGQRGETTVRWKDRFFRNCFDFFMVVVVRCSS